jgi:Protein of unknown function (DUF3455)
MNPTQAQTPQTTHLLLLVTCVAALAVASIAAQPPLVRAADRIVTRTLPPDLDPVPAGHKAFLEGHAIGTQNYICLPSNSDSGLSWTFFGPQATLFDDKDKQIITHFLSANPNEDDALRPTWQHSRDTSTVWARPIDSTSDAGFVDPGAIPWLLLEVIGVDPGPTGGHTLTRTTYIQRLNTLGGVAPSTECRQIGQRLFVPYEADYVFYKAIKRDWSGRPHP